MYVSSGICATATLLVILITRLVLGKLFGPTAFDAWGWRIPFLFSAGLLAVSIFMRMKLSESPTFAKMKAEGDECKAPFSEAFGPRPSGRSWCLRTPWYFRSPLFRASRSFRALGRWCCSARTSTGRRPMADGRSLIWSSRQLLHH